MEGENFTALSDFILLGFSDVPELHTPMFIIFLSLYTLLVMGNLLLMLLINTDPQLYTPMYFFLTHLSFMDLCLSSAVIPKALETFLLGTSNISFVGCFAQMHVFIMLVTCECFLLGVMAYDRYAAVCQPLHYVTLMSRACCYKMTVLVYATGFLTSLVHMVLAGRLAFCQARSINHFFCELPALLRLSCSSTRPNHILQVCSAELNIVGSILVILASYACILYTVLRMPSAGARLKVFSTCTSHLAAVTIFCVAGLVTYMLPSKARPEGEEKLVSIFYTAVTPLLNPLVYSLRNRAVKGALRRLWGQRLFPQLPWL
ncbi:olfactory receptor 8I2-like [Oxyura jamaicensis]|uniref:olfactory receptor 8I2-like n=1 Tax=Oxyura jamaicensis TaxID=8884 RepID=UPI0015A61564|nr:olfactory receptor 8I2-like [Oxyura jamaicensis]